MPRYSTELMGTPDELFYWVPGEMVVVRLHRRPTPDTQDLLVEQIRGQLNSLLAPYNMVLELYGTYGRWRDIPTMPPANVISRIAAGKESRTEKLFGSGPDVPDLIANVIRVQQRFGIPRTSLCIVLSSNILDASLFAVYNTGRWKD